MAVPARYAQPQNALVSQGYPYGNALGSQATPLDTYYGANGTTGNKTTNNDLPQWLRNLGMKGDAYAGGMLKPELRYGFKYKGGKIHFADGTSFVAKKNKGGTYSYTDATGKAVTYSPTDEQNAYNKKYQASTAGTFDKLKESLDVSNHMSPFGEAGLLGDPLHYIGGDKYDNFMRQTWEKPNEFLGKGVTKFNVFDRQLNPLHAAIDQTKFGAGARQLVENKPADVIGSIFGGGAIAAGLGGGAAGAGAAGGGTAAGTGTAGVSGAGIGATSAAELAALPEIVVTGTTGGIGAGTVAGIGAGAGVAGNALSSSYNGNNSWSNTSDPAASFGSSQTGGNAGQLANSGGITTGAGTGGTTEGALGSLSGAGNSLSGVSGSNAGGFGGNMGWDWGSIINTGATLLGGYLQGQGSKDAAKESAAGSAAAIAESRRQYDQSRADQMPWLQAGQGALGRLQNPAASFQASPDYAFRRDEGTRDIGNSFSARGGAQSGNALRALTDFNSGLAGGEYGNWWNRQAGLAGVGQTSAANLGSLGANSAANVGNALQNGANARASGVEGQTNAYTGALADLLSQYNRNRKPQYGWGGG